MNRSYFTAMLGGFCFCVMLILFMGASQNVTTSSQSECVEVDCFVNGCFERSAADRERITRGSRQPVEVIQMYINEGYELVSVDDGRMYFCK